MPEQTPDTHDRPQTRWSDLALFVLLYFACLAMAMGVARLLPLAQQNLKELAAQGLGYILWFAALNAWQRVKYGETLAQAVGWRYSSHWIPRALLYGVLTLPAVAALGLLIKSPYVNTPVVKLLEKREMLFWVMPVLCLIGPLAEEIAFRGLLQRMLAPLVTAPVAIVVTGFLFGLIHGPQLEMRWANIALIAIAGVLFGAVRHWSNSTFAAWLMHAAYNTTALGGYLVGKQ